MAGKYPYYLQRVHKSRERTREHRYSPHGVVRITRHRHSGVTKIEGLSYDVVRRKLHEKQPPRRHRIHQHHIGTGHHKLRTLTSAGHHQLGMKHPHRLHHKSHESTSILPGTATTTAATASKVKSTVRKTSTATSAQRTSSGALTGYAAYWAHTTKAERSAIARKAAATRKREGIKPWGGHTWATYDKSLSPAQRHLRALKSAATRRSRHENNFAHESHATRVEAARRAAATRRREGIKPFAHESAATRHLAARRAAATRKARGENNFSRESSAKRHSAAIKAGITRKAKHER